MDPYVEALRDSADPCIAYRARRLLDELPDRDEDQRRRRRQVVETPNVRRLLAHRGPDGTIRYGNGYHAYRKFQGAHWTLASLAELGYPSGDHSLMPVVEQIHEWLTSPQHLRPPSTEVTSRYRPAHPSRTRRAAGQCGRRPGRRVPPEPPAAVAPPRRRCDPAGPGS